MNPEYNWESLNNVYYNTKDVNIIYLFIYYVIETIILQLLIIIVDLLFYNDCYDYIFSLKTIFSCEDKVTYISNNERIAVQEQSKENNNIVIYKLSKPLHCNHKISCSFEKNKCNVIYGKNESKKSALLYMLSGLMKYVNGIIYVNGLNLNENKSFIKKDVSFCYKNEILYDFLTVEEHLELYIFININFL